MEKEDLGRKYKNKVVFLHKSKAGEHLYAFDYKGAFITAIEGSIIINVSEVLSLIEGSTDSIKVSIIPKKELDEEDGTKAEGR